MKSRTLKNYVSWDLAVTANGVKNIEKIWKTPLSRNWRTGFLLLEHIFLVLLNFQHKTSYLKNWKKIFKNLSIFLVKAQEILIFHHSKWLQVFCDVTILWACSLLIMVFALGSWSKYAEIMIFELMLLMDTMHLLVSQIYMFLCSLNLL